MKKFMKILGIFGVPIVLISILLFGSVFAQGNAVVQSSLANPSYEFPVSSIFRNDVAWTNSDWSGNIDALFTRRVPGIVILVSLVATVLIVVGGITMIISGGSSEKVSAGKKMIIAPLLAVVFALSAYLIVIVLGRIIGT